MYSFRYVSVEEERPDLLIDWLQLRTRMYCDAGFIDPTYSLSGSLYHDKYDAYSLHVLIYDTERPDPVGCFRSVDGRQGNLPSHEAFGLVGGPCARELSGFAVLPTYRKTFASFGCYWMMFARSIEEDFSAVHAVIEQPLLDSLRSLGLPVRTAGEGKIVFNTWNLPIVIRPDECINALLIADAARGFTTRFAEQMQKPWTGQLRSEDLFAHARSKVGVN